MCVRGTSAIFETRTFSWSCVTPGWMIRMSGCASGENKKVLGGHTRGLMQCNDKGANHALLLTLSARMCDWEFGVWERNLTV